MRIGLTYDLRADYLAAGYSEHETAEFERPDTIEAIVKTLTSLGHRVEKIGNVQKLTRRLAAGKRWDLVFNICEGLNGFGREAQVPALLDAYSIPYTFSDPLVLALALHKGMTKHVIRDNGLATPSFVVIDDPVQTRKVRLPMPLFAKPVAEGTSKGVDAHSKIQSLAELERVCAALIEEYGEPVLVETYLPGREFTVGLIGTGAAARAIGTLEVKLRPEADAEVYSYRNKENCESLVEYLLLDEPMLAVAVEGLALRAWRALGCRDAGRVDVRMDARGVPNFIEVNPLAGLHPDHSDLPILCKMKGMSYRELISGILESAGARLPQVALPQVAAGR
jgi:D-alanine-D-alanine ligase